MEKQLILYNKPVCEILSQSITNVKEKYKIKKDIKVSYAGRLDPLASGLLLCLVGEECKNRDYYQNLSKVYEFKVLFGFSTDSGDLMGKITLINKKNNLKNLDLLYQVKVKSLIGKFKQKYPNFSSYRIKSKPLFWWARNNKIENIKIPSKEVELFSLKYLSKQEYTIDNILSIQNNYLSKVVGDFRQDDILSNWKENKQFFPKSIYALTFEAKVSSGFYIRSLANSLAGLVGQGGIAYKIHRKAIGNYSL